MLFRVVLLLGFLIGAIASTPVLDLLRSRSEGIQFQSDYKHIPFEKHVTPSGEHSNNMRFIHPQNGYVVDYTSHMKTLAPIFTIHTHPNIADVVVVHPMSEEVAANVEHENIKDEEYKSSLDLDHHIGFTFTHEDAAVEFEKFIAQIIENGEHLENEDLPWPLFVHPSTHDHYAFTEHEDHLVSNDHNTHVARHFVLSHSTTQSSGADVSGVHDAVPIPPMLRVDEHKHFVREGNMVHIGGLNPHPYANIVSHSRVNLSADPPKAHAPGYDVHSFKTYTDEDDLFYADRDAMGDEVDEQSEGTDVTVQGLDPSGMTGRIMQQHYWTFDHQFGIFLNYDKKADYAPPIDLLSKAPEWLTTLGGGGQLILQLIDTYAVARAGIRVQFDAGITGVSYFKAEIIGDLGAGVGYLFEVVFDTDELNPWISVGGTIIPKFRVFSFAIPAGPIIIPVSLDLGFGAGAGVSMRGGFRHSASATAGVKVRYGVEYTKDSGFQKINEYSPPTLELDAGEPDFYFEYLDLDLLANVTLVPKVFNLGPDMVSMWDLKMRFTSGGDQCAPGSLSYKTYLIGDLSIEIPAVNIPFLSGRVDLGEFLPLPWFVTMKLFVSQLTCPFCGGCLGLQDLFNAFKNTTPVITARPEYASLSAFEVIMPDGTLFDKNLDPYVRADLVCKRVVDQSKPDETIDITLQSAMTVTKENDSCPFYDDVLAFKLPQDLKEYPDCYINVTLFDDGSDSIYLTNKVLFSTCPPNQLRCTKSWDDDVTMAALGFNVDFWPEVEPTAWTDALNFIPDVPRFYRMKIPEGTTTLALAGSQHIPEDDQDDIDVDGSSTPSGDTTSLEDSFTNSTEAKKTTGTQAKVIFTAVPDGCGAPSPITSILDPYPASDQLLATPIINLPTENKGDVVDMWIHRVKIKKAGGWGDEVDPQVRTRIKYLYADEEVVTPFPSLEELYPPKIKENKWFDYYEACPTANTTVCQPNSVFWSFPEVSFDYIDFYVHDKKDEKNVFHFTANSIDYTKVGEIITISSADTNSLLSRVEGDSGDSTLEIRYRVRRATEYVIGARLASSEREADVSIVGMPHQIPKYANVGSLGTSAPSLAFGLPIYDNPPDYDASFKAGEMSINDVLDKFNFKSEDLRNRVFDISHHSLLDLDSLKEADELYMDHHNAKKEASRVKTMSADITSGTFGADDENDENMEIPPPLTGQNLIAATGDSADLSTVSVPLNNGNGSMIFLDPEDVTNQDVSMVLELSNPTSGWVEVQTLHPEGQPFPAIGVRPGLSVTTKQVRPIIGAVVKKQEEDKVASGDADDQDGSDDYFEDGKTLAEYGAGVLQARMWLRVYSAKAFKGRLFMLPYTLSEAGKSVILTVGDSGQHIIEVRVEPPFDAFYVERSKEASDDDHEFSLAFAPEDGDIFSSKNRVAVKFQKGEIRTENPYAVSTLRTLLLAQQGTVTDSITIIPYGMYTAKSAGATQLPYEGGKFLLSVEGIIYGKEARQRYLRVRSEAKCGFTLEDDSGKDITPRKTDDQGQVIDADLPLGFEEELWPDWHDAMIWPSDQPASDPDEDDPLDSYSITYSQLIPVSDSTDVIHVMNDEAASTNSDVDEYGITSATTEFFIVDVINDLEKEPLDGEHWSSGGDSHLVFNQIPFVIDEKNASRAVIEFIVDSRETNLVGSAMVHYNANGFLGTLPFELIDPAEDRELRTPKTISSADSSAYMRQIVPVKFLVDRVRQAGYLSDGSVVKINVGVKTRKPSYFNARLRYEPEDLEIKITQSEEQAERNRFTFSIPNEVAVAFDPSAFLAPSTLRQLGANLRYSNYKKQSSDAATTQRYDDDDDRLNDGTDENTDDTPTVNKDKQLAALEKAFRSAGFDQGLSATFDDYLVTAEVEVPVKYADSGFNRPIKITFDGLPNDFTSSNTTIPITGSFVVTPSNYGHSLLFWVGVCSGSVAFVAGAVFGVLFLLKKRKNSASYSSF